MHGILMFLAFAATSFFGGARAHLTAPPVPATALVECTWHLGGGMRGGHDIIKIVRSGDVAVITTSRAEWHNSVPEETSCEVPLETLDEIKAIFASERMNEWTKLPMSPERLLDADTWSMSFAFDGPGNYDKRHFRFMQEQMLPRGGRDAVREILEILREIERIEMMKRIDAE